MYALGLVTWKNFWIMNYQVSMQLNNSNCFKHLCPLFLLEDQSSDIEASSSDDEKATTLDTSTDDVLSSDNDEMHALNDQMTTQAVIDEMMTAYQSMLLLCQIVQFISQPIITNEEIATLYKLIHDHHKSYKAAHGQWEVSINYHLALHIPDVIADFGPPWCFGYERINGFLAGFPNSKVNIEPQIMNRMLLQLSYASSTLPGFLRIHMMQKYIYILGWTSMIMCTLQSLTPLIEDRLLKQCLYLKKIMNCIHTMVAFSFSSESASH